MLAQVRLPESRRERYPRSMRGGDPLAELGTDRTDRISDATKVFVVLGGKHFLVASKPWKR